MYITGSKYNLEVRMHEFVRNSGDLNQYILESQGYTLPIYISEKLNREHHKQIYSIHSIVDTGKHF
jgi:hypothetical protein